MAFREVRFLVATDNKEANLKITKEIYQPFTWYMDTLMRGRFKEYSGDEVKGINLVNLRLYTKSMIKLMQEQAGCDLEFFGEWLPTLNTLQLESVIDLDELKGTRIEKVNKSLEIFMGYAAKSELPQMKILLQHLQESMGKQSIEEAIEKADNYLKRF